MDETRSARARIDTDVPPLPRARALLPVRRLALLLSLVLVPVACGPPPSERPREGAPVATEGQPPRPDDPGGPLGGPPPTLAPPLAPGASPVALGPGGAVLDGAVPGGPSPSPSPSPVPGFVIVATDGAGVNLRTGPSTSAPVITTLAEGTAVEVIGEPITSEGRAWRQVRSGTRQGWVVAVVVRPRPR